ncbi:MAG: glycerate kinase type-2 family protein [Planctomycetaceae bacterium]
MPASDQLRTDALAIWRAGVDAVGAERLVHNVMRCTAAQLSVCGHEFALAELGRIAVVGAGKAGAGMAAAVEDVLGPQVVDERVVGWVNVPADCVRPLRKIHLHPARPAGVNEPTEAGVSGATRILEIVSSLEARDLCLVLISGGGSALLPAPVPEISLADKQAVTRFLMSSGATIQELNAVRTPLSRVKGGGLARAIRAGTAISLIISDVIGDPLDVIASGPTVVSPLDVPELIECESLAPAVHRHRGAPLRILEKFGGGAAVPQKVVDYLNCLADHSHSAAAPTAQVYNHIIGNNAMAVAAASKHAAALGYAVHSLTVDEAGEANAVGRAIAERCLEYHPRARPPLSSACLVGGGEPVVKLTSENRGKGGRNQQLVLSAIDRLWTDWPAGVVILSGGTDGEDGPTDAAGALADAALVERARALQLDPRAFLERNDAYRFFEPLDGLIKTGPTHTNVMDLRVALVAP